MIGWHLDNISFRPPAGVERPRVLGTKFPGSPERAHAFVVVSFEVDEHGKPVNLHADKSSDEQWESKMMDAVKGWRFEPGMKDGAPVVVPCTVRIAIGR